MKSSITSPSQRLVASITTMVTALLLPTAARAASGNWTATAGGSWGTAASWSPAAVPGSAAGDVININSNITAAATITLDANRTVGTLLIGDSDSTHGFTLSTGATTTNVLILDQTATGTALVRFGVAGSTAAVANAISAGITLNDNARFYSTLTGVQTLSGVITGAKSVTFDNDDGVTAANPVSLQGQFAVSGTNTYSGGTTIDDVRVTISGNNAALGTGAVTILDGGQVFNSTGLTAIANTFNIAGNGWLETAGQLGALRLDSGAIVTGAVNLTGNAAIGSNSGVGTVNGVVAGGFQLSKVGAGTLVLGGANTYSGGTLVSAGILQANSNSALGAGGLTIAGATSRLIVNGGVTLPLANAITVNTGITGVANTGLVMQTGTGQARVNGAITLNSAPSAGGTFMGGTAVGNELILGGAISSTANLGASQRDGRVVYAGGGSATGQLLVTGTALAGATNGIPQAWTVTLGGSAAGALDLNGFDQTLTAVKFGNLTPATGIFAGTVNLGGKTLTLGGDVTTQLAGGTVAAAPHFINATAGGTLAFGGTARNLSVADNTLTPDDLTIGAVTLTGSGLTKTGTGTLALNGTTLSTPLTLSAGTLAIGTNGTVGTASAAAMNFAGSSTLRMKVGTSGDLLTVTNANGLTTAGTTTVSLNQFGGILAAGTYPLINYNGTSPGLAGFSLNPVGHTTSSLIDTGSAIALSVTGNDRVIWDGTTSTAWATGVTGNWKLQSSPSTATDYIESDEVIFQDAPTNSTVAIAANVNPANVTFTNTTATSYALTGAAGIAGPTGLLKSGNGTVMLSNPNTYLGATTVQAGTLVLDHATTTPLFATTPIAISSGATVKFSHTGGVFSLVNPISGTGNIVLDPSTTTTGNRDIATVTWNATGFTGLLNLKPTLGTMRMQVDNPADLGSANVQVDAGGQVIFTAANQTYGNNFSIAGTGYSEAAGTLGAMRANNTTTFTGVITLAANAKIGALGGTAISTNSITGSGAQILTVGGSINNASGETLAITGTVSNLASITVNDGTATSGATSIALNVGNNTSSGTIGAIPVNLNPDGFKNAVVRFDRTDGYTLGAPITTIGATAANYVRSFVDADSQGAGFSDGGFSINLGGSTTTTGGQFRVGTNRANSIGNISGTLTAGTVQAGAGSQPGSVLNFNSGANATFGTLNLAFNNAASNGAIVNFNNGSTVNADYFSLGNVASGGGTVNQAAGSIVNIVSQLRVGHFGTETTTYSMNGGTLTMTGASPTLTPSTSGAGGANATGDNNINAGAAATAIVGGGIYIGNDGQGTLNHSGGTITTNWIVLDNRGDTVAGANMVDGIDRYNLSGAGSILNLRSTWGLIQRNASAAVSFGGGTVRVDNSGTGGPAGNTGANLNIPLDANIATVASTTTNLDTNGATNAFTLNRDITGTGTLNLIGGGNINLTTTGTQIVNANISGTTPLVKQGAGTTTLLGSASSYTGNVTISAGRLNVPNNLGAGNLAVADGAAVGGEPVLVNTLTFGTTTGGTIFFDPNTAGAMTTGSLMVNGPNLIDLTAVPSAAGPYTVINYTSKSGAGSFAAANSTNYRVTPTVADTGAAITLDITGRKDLTWTGAASTAWNINSAINWNDTTSAPEKFYTLDNVTFPEGAANASIALTGLLAPASITVNAATTAYTFTSTAGNQITGGTGITKTGGGSLTLAGPNLYNGLTSIGGGTVVINGSTSLGSGVSGNSIAISGGGRLSYTTAAAMDLGVNRSIAVGTGGGSLSYNNAAAATTTMPGNLTGSGTDSLSFHSQAAGGGTFLLTGDNSGYTGKISVDSTGTGLTILRLGSQAAVPAGGSITVNYPVGATTSGNANTLDLNTGRILPAGLTLNMGSNQLSSTVSIRSQVIANAGSTNVINGPISLAGTSTIQFTVNTPGSFTYNNTITETTPGSFVEATALPLFYSNVLFFRGTGLHTLNSTVNLPSAGSSVAITDGATAVFNTTGNVWKSTNALFGTMRLGIDDALNTSARLVVGQTGDQATTVDLNGFNQTVGGLEWQAPTGNLLTKGISNSNATTTSTFTVNQATAPTINANFNGTISGKINFVKDGAATVSLIAPASNFTGNVTVNAGTLSATGVGAANGANGTLGAANVAGKTITVNNTGTLNLLTNNIFGSGVGNANLPAVVVNAGGIVSSTRYNAVGDVTLNGGVLTQASTDGPTTYEGYQFRGGITAGGTTVSTISTTNGKGNHLGSNTTISVADATGDALPDLIISAPLRNQSADFASAAGGFTKTGNGTLQLTAASTYTGTTSVTGGTLLLGVDNALPATSALNLSSGTTLATGGFSDSTGLLTLNSGVTFDMGVNGSGSVLTFSDVSTWSGILNVWNYTGAPWTPGTDKLIFSTNIANINLANVNFYSDKGLTPYDPVGGATIVNGTELVPVPEPTAIAGTLGLLGLLGFRERRRLLHFRK